MSEWIDDAMSAIKGLRIEHRTYVQAVEDLFNALWAAIPGEVVVIVGPSRVGKSRALKSALGRVARTHTNEIRPWVVVQGSNESVGGSFTTKAFMQRACKAVEHPIFGVPDEDDIFMARLSARLHRTSEPVLRQAFETALQHSRTRFLAFDESHHVGYAPGGVAQAARILDSWKCLALEANVVLILAGSYKLLPLLNLAPHLLGRQRPIEFPRYLINLKADTEQWESILETYEVYLRRSPSDRMLRDNNRLLFEGTFGCIGHLSKWIRSALAWMRSHQMTKFETSALLATRFPAKQAKAIAEEIAQGERDLATFDDAEADSSLSEHKSGKPNKDEAKAPKRKPFQRAIKRRPRNGRA